MIINYFNWLGSFNVVHIGLFTASNSVSNELMWTTATTLEYDNCRNVYGNGDQALQICLSGMSACNVRTFYVYIIYIYSF